MQALLPHRSQGEGQNLWAQLACGRASELKGHSSQITACHARLGTASWQEEGIANVFQAPEPGLASAGNCWKLPWKVPAGCAQI